MSVELQANQAHTLSSTGNDYLYQHDDSIQQGDFEQQDNIAQ